MGIVIAIIVVVVVGSVTAGGLYLRTELRPTPLPSSLYRRRAPRRAVPGDDCVCGGTIGKSGRTSKRFGDLLGCTACSRLWTMDGRRVRRRRSGYAQQAAGGGD
jgi:hypothetical protein